MLTTNRKTPRRTGEDFRHPVAANAVIHAGALVVLEGGFAKPGYVKRGLIAAGRAEEAVKNTGGTNGQRHVSVRRGVFAWKNDTSINRTHIGAKAYIVDDQTVGAAAGSGRTARSTAGTILDVDDDGVWVAT